jgi:hypothetical protein
MLRGTRTSRGAASSAAGERRGCPASLLLIRVAPPGRRPGATAEIPPGGQSSRGSTRWSTWSQLQGCQPNRGPTLWQLGMQRALLKLFQVVRSSDGLDFPWVAGPAAGLCCGPPGNGNSQGRQHLCESMRRRPICVKPSSSLVIRVVRSCDGLDSHGRPAQLQDAVGHPGSSSSDHRPAAAPRCGGLSEWPDHSKLRGATRGRRAANSAAGRSVLPGNVRPPVQPRVYAVVVSPSGRLHRRLRGAARSRWMAGVAAGMKSVRQVGN